MNAKDLALAKINAGPKMFGFYAYGISIGMDIRELAKIINTPQGRAISKLCEGNIVNGEMGAFSALLAINKLEGKGLQTTLELFDVISAVEAENAGAKVSENRPIKLKEKSIYTASEALKILLQELYNIALKNSTNVTILRNKLDLPPDAKLPKAKDLATLVRRLALMGLLDRSIYFATNKSELWLSLLNELSTISNQTDWKYSLYQLVEYCQQYGKLVNTYYTRDEDVLGKYIEGGKYLARDLKILAQGAEEMRILGSILSSNKGVKSKTEEGMTFIKNIENSVIERKKLMGLEIAEDDRIDFVAFCTDDLYRLQAIAKYEQVKHSVNILDVVSTASHFYSYLRTCSIPYVAFKAGSVKFRTKNKYYDLMLERLKLTRSKDKENVGKGIENAVNYKMFLTWANNNNIKFWLPKGCKKFVGRYEEAIPSTGEYIPLGDKDGNGLATFKYYMENEIIPKLMQRPSFLNNSFIQGLTPFELTKTGTHAAVTAYTLNGNMMPYTESLVVQLQNYVADFARILDQNFPSGDSKEENGIFTYQDAFYLYSLYVFGGKRGLRSLVSLLSGKDYPLAQNFILFEAEQDATREFFEFDLRELDGWCAPESNTYKPSAEIYYATPVNSFGKVLMAQVDNEVEDPETGKKVVLGKKNSKVEKELSILNRLVYIGRTTDLNDKVTGPSTFSFVLEDETKYLNIPLSIGGLFSITLNKDRLLELVFDANNQSQEYLDTIKFIKNHLGFIGESISTEKGVLYKIKDSLLNATIEEAIKLATRLC